LALTIFAGTAVGQTGERYCELSLRSCPETYDGKTLQVPLEVVSLSANIRACATAEVNGVTTGDPPAIMFIIDHSTSMVSQTSECSGGGCDPNGNRFRVTRALIDSIYKTFPNAEVGITIFSNGLVLDSDRDENLVQFASVDVSDSFGVRQSYMPLKPLNAPALTGGTNPFAGANASPSIIDVYRGMFTQAAVGRWALKDRSEMRGTNISLAFEAALEEFKRTSIPKKDQYIIFLSDGSPGLIQSQTGVGPCTGHYWCGREYDFAEGTNTPTTYTVFLQGNAINPTAPDILQTMTTNVQNNGYSETNPQSSIWAVNAGYESLLNLMMDNIFTEMLTQTQGTPKKIVVESAGIIDSTDQVIDSAFDFGRMLPIDTGAIAPVKMGIYYTRQVDTVDVVTGQAVSFQRDEKLDYQFWIRRTANPPADWATSQGLSSTCDSKPSIALLRGGVPIDTIKQNMTNLTVRFEKGGGFTYNRDNVPIVISNTNNTPCDTVWTDAIRQSSSSSFREDVNYIYWDFTLNTNQPNPSTANTQLEFQGVSDNIVFFYRNPYIPLDTIRLIIPYINDGDTGGGNNDTGPFILTIGQTASGGAISADPSLSSYAAGTLVTVTATPASGYTFTGWGGNLAGIATSPYTFAINQDMSITAIFTKQNDSDSANNGSNNNNNNNEDAYSRFLNYVNNVINERTGGRGARPSAVLSADIFSGQFTAGPNPAGRGGAVGFFRMGGEVNGGKLAIYDVLGNHVKSVEANDRGGGNLGRRRIGSWDLTDRKGRPVSAGVYLVRGVLTQKGGGKARVSIIVNVNN